MQRPRILAAFSILALAATTGIAGYSQDEHKDKNQQQPPSKHREAGQAPRSAQPQRPPQQAQDQLKKPAPPRTISRPFIAPKQSALTAQQQHDQQISQRQAWQERRANHWEYERRSWQQRGGYQGVHINDDYFRQHFGASHVFRVYNLPFIYEAGDPRFQYEGYWFTMMDPYPEYWGATWYETDDLYIDYQGDGYYLFNRGFPGHPGIALNITL